MNEDINIIIEPEKDIAIVIPTGGVDGQSIHPVGEWSESANYNFLDLVSYYGSSYVAKRYVPAGTSLADSEYWQLSASAGEGGTDIIPGDDLEIVNGVLNIIKATSADQDNTHPITAAAVYTEIGNINVLLQTI